MDVFVNSKKIRADPKRAIGKGGEADVFDIGNGKALKLFKPPNHPDYQGLPQEQKAAGDRLMLHQQKLRQFPPNLPQRVIAPEALAMDKAGQILGYTMPLLKGAEPLLRYGERSFRQAGISTQTVVQIFQDLHNAVSKLHFAGVVIGDFNDLNILVKGTEAYLIDADSFQFGAFFCQMFTARFVDPLLCHPQANQPLLQQPHNPDSDWYAFAVMLMQCLLFVDPYGGVYKPKDPSRQVLQGARSLHRITVFHPEVRYPKPAIPYQVLPDELLHHFHQVFEQDVRGEFPRSLLENLHWQTCSRCGMEYARPVCPQCSPCFPQLGQVQEHQGKLEDKGAVVRGTVVASRLFFTEGVILFATVVDGTLQWLYHDQGQFQREDGSVVLKGELNPQLRWQIQGQTTFLGYQGQVIRFHPSHPPERVAVDSLGAIAQFNTNAAALYWLSNGQLLRSTYSLGQAQGTAGQAQGTAPTYIGDVLLNQTWFWIGSGFGFGFYQAGGLKVAFVFDAQKPGINDRVRLPQWQGQLMGATCTFSNDLCWLFLTTQEQGQIHYRCVVIQSNGAIAASLRSVEGEDNWLATLGKSGTNLAVSKGCAMSNFLLLPTDEGIIRIELQQGHLVQTKAFPDTEPFVDSSCQLLPGSEGLYVVNRQEIRLVKLNGQTR